MKKIGDKIEIQANEILGTPEAMATVKEVCDFGYMVHIDGDDPDWTGPVDFNGNVLCEN